MTSDAISKIIDVLEKRGFTQKKPGLYQLGNVAVDLATGKPEVGVFINNILQTEGHGNSKADALKQELLNIWEMNGNDEIEKETPLPTPKEPDIVKPKGDEKMIESKKEEALPAVITQGFLSPATTIEDAVAVFDMFEQAKTKLLKDTDVLWIGANGRPAPKGTGHPHIKRSGWRKLARFFGINCSIIDKEKLTSKDSEGEFYLWKFRVRAQHPRGGYFEAEGVCSSRDPFFSKKGGIRVEPDEADIMLKAQTVAFNRATSDLLGSGEVSADEIKYPEAKS